MDLEDRAYLLTATNQRWLSVRLDLLGACLVFAVAVMAADGGGGLTPSQIALCLTYMTTVVQIFGMVGLYTIESVCSFLQMTRQTAEVENNSESPVSFVSAVTDDLHGSECSGASSVVCRQTDAATGTATSRPCL